MSGGEGRMWGEDRVWQKLARGVSGGEGRMWGEVSLRSQSLRPVLHWISCGEAAA